mgnify:CR=1 FL=1
MSPVTQTQKRGERGEVMENGVMISLKEMYVGQQEVISSLNRLESRMVSLETRVSRSTEADERSREAIERAKDAEEEAASAHKRIKRIEEKIDKIMISIILALATGAIGALFYFAQVGLGG